jgi:hypothetical protein
MSKPEQPSSEGMSGFYFAPNAFNGLVVNTINFITMNSGSQYTVGIPASKSGSFDRSKSCPLSTTREQRTEWGIACALQHTAPEGWTKETFSSPKAFTNGVTPSGLTPGDAIFYWTQGDSETPVPNGFEGCYASDNIVIITPATTSEEGFDDDDDDDSSLSSEGNFDDDDGDDDLLEENTDEEESTDF